MFENTVEKIKYTNTNNKENAFRYSNNYNNIQRSQKFFVKPQIKIYGLNSNPVNVTVTNFGLNPVPFRIIVWSLQIENIDKKIIGSKSSLVKKIPYISKLGEKTTSKDVFNCAVTFNIIDDHRLIFPQFRSLHWRTLEFPTETNLNISTMGNSEQERRDAYLSQLPPNFIGELLGNNSLADLPKKTERDILLFFTVEGLGSLYFISHDGMDLFREEDVPQLTFPFNEFRLNIVFQCTESSYSKGVSYNVIPTSWDNIHIQVIN